MDFGRSFDIQEYERINFVLPQFPEFSAQQSSKLYFGGTQWASTKFKGTLYPWNARKDDFLKLYAAQFNSMELNTTYHSIPSEATVHQWVSQVKNVNPDFKFCPKIPKVISHEGRLDAHFDLIPQFVRAIEHFGKHLGLCFLQLHPNYSPRNFEHLKGFFDLWPKHIPLAVEFRHSGWFHKNLMPALQDFLAKNHSSMVITDTHLRRDVLHSQLHTSHLMIRFVANCFHDKDQLRMSAWAEQLKRFKLSGPQDVYFFIHDDENFFFPDASYMANLLSDHFTLPTPNGIERADHGQLNFF